MTLATFAEATLLGVPVGLALGLVGGGGSILAVPILVGVLGVSPQFATSASLVIVAANASGALWQYVQDRLVKVQVAVLVALSGVVGTAVGTVVNKQLDSRLLTTAFAILMVVIAVQMLRGGTSGPQECPESLGALPPVKLLVVGTLVGLTTGFFGVGGGFVIVPALLSLGLCMRQAVPTSLLVIVLNSLIALGLRSASGSAVPLGYALPMILGGLGGTAMAVRLAPKLGNVGLSKAFAILTLVLAGYLAWTVKGNHA
jgi:uncharacterized membrane protein YfcA